MISGADPEIEFSTILKIFSKRSRIQPLLLKVHINCLEEPKYLFKPGQPSRGVERTFFYYGPGTITCIWNDIILINEAPYRYRYQIVHRTDNKWSEGMIWIILISICVCKSVPRPILRNRKWSRDYDVIGHFCKKSIIFQNGRIDQEHDAKVRLSISGPSPEISVAEIIQLKKLTLTNFHLR